MHAHVCILCVVHKIVYTVISLEILVFMKSFPLMIKGRKLNEKIASVIEHAQQLRKYPRGRGMTHRMAHDPRPSQ